MVVNAAAANPTNTVLVAFTGTNAAIVCTVTPNDGTNNTGTAVNLTTAHLVTLINNGSYSGVTLTDASSLRALQTATGGDTTALAHAGEGDNKTATFSGGVDAGFTNISKWGISSLVEITAGTYRLTFQDRWISLKMFNGCIVKVTGEDNLFQLKDVSSLNATIPYIDFFINTAGTPTAPADQDKIKLGIELKNTSVTV